MQNFSQNNEQLHIIRLMKEKRNGTFIDLGANDGVTFSNTYALARYYGWAGLLVEASPKAYEKLLSSYQKDYFNDREFDLANVAVGKEDGVLDLYESGSLKDPRFTGENVALVSTGIEKEVDRWNGTVSFEKIQVPMESIKTILSKSRFHKFDVLSIDIEGMELEVLRQMDLEGMGIKVACIEFNGNHEREFNQIMKGFRLVHKNAENLIYFK